ncbi:MAG TPA: glycoside hydrolase family 3 N-terminal domain-containing protein [Vicinamibacteria bacterium]|nr:glycoside hydrolase family 3 N-terminal domain-containing protein [Vicinamibacteria bacterium]
MNRDALALGAPALLCAAGLLAAPSAADPKAESWVRRTLKGMSLEEKAGQVVFPGLNGVYTPKDSEAAERLDRLVREGRVGGFHVFGGAEALPPVLLNPAYGTSGGRATRGDAIAIAVLLNRLQRASALPLLFTADFEGGTGYIVAGGTRLPRAMALGATRDERLAERAGRLAAGEGRALGVHVDFYPVVDVNNNPQNPVINVRSFGEDPALVARMAAAYLRGVQAGGMLATAKHFPGHGDTTTDTHLDLAVIEHPRERLDAVELVPFRAAIAAGVDAVMSTHIRLPALDPTEGLPATLSRPILTGLLRQELGFGGLVFTDSMSMQAISRRFPPDRAAAMAVAAGADVVLDTPDPGAARRGIRDAVERGEIPREQLDRSVERLLRAKARLGLHRARTVDVEAVPAGVGGRTREALAAEIASKAITLLEDEHGQVPLRLRAGARVLLLSLVDSARGWREGAPGRVFVPELRKRWADVTAAEVSDRTPAAEIDLLEAIARRSDAVVAATYVRIGGGKGRLGLAPAQQELLEHLGADPARPLVVVAFGSPYVGDVAPRVPAVLVTYELGDAPEAAAARALCGEAPIGGKLPVTIPGLFPLGHGLERAAAIASSGAR